MNLLIVDDEYYNVENIRELIAEKRPEFTNIFCAYNMHHALDYFSRHEIHMMICDIEMPGGSGLELLDQIRGMGSSGKETICIFLTAFAKFEYISAAMKLSSIEYLLKPVDDEELLAAVDKAVEKVYKNRQASINMVQAGYWKESRLSLMEVFWQDLLDGSISPVQKEIHNELVFRKLPTGILADSFYLLLIESHPDRQTRLEHSLYEFTLKNIVREYFYRADELPVVIKLSKELYLLPLAVSKGLAAEPFYVREDDLELPARDGTEKLRNREEILLLCGQAFQSFVRYFQNNFNFYVSRSACRLTEAPQHCRELLSAVQKNVSLENHVFDLAASELSGGTAKDRPLPSERWMDLLLQGKIHELAEDASWYLKQLGNTKDATVETLTAFYYSFLQLLIRQLQSSQEAALQLFYDRLAAVSADGACSSLHSLNEWILDILNIYTVCIAQTKSPNSVVSTVTAYIREHLDQEMNRNTLAAVVYLNPDYLSHIFKNETGQSIINFIISERIAESKRLLSQTDLNIRDIAIACGFQNISYFSRQFKKATGMTPREFRGRPD